MSEPQMEHDENYHIAQLSKQFRYVKETCEQQREEIQSLREIVRAINIKAGNSAEDYYAWMPFEQNHIETLAVDCPVLIPAGWLRQLIAEGQERLQAECAAMREALLRAAENGFDGMYAACPLCNERIEAVGGIQIHKPDGTIGNALSLNSAAQWLERYKAMERLHKAVRLAEDIRSEVFPLLASDEEQAAWVTEWESRLHLADGEVEAALEALEAMERADTRG